MTAGGLRHLFSILMSSALDTAQRTNAGSHVEGTSVDDSDNHKDTKAACLALLLKVINLLTVGKFLLNLILSQQLEST